MASKRRHYRPANIFRGFVKAFPIILIPAAALLCEAWLHLGILTFDYEGRALSMERAWDASQGFDVAIGRVGRSEDRLVD